MTFPERLRLVVGERRERPFAREAGVFSDSALRKWLAGISQPDLDNLISIAKTGMVNLLWLATGEGPMRPGEEKGDVTPAPQAEELAMVPRYDVAAGMGAAMVVHSEQIVDHLAFKRMWLRDLGLEPGKLALVDARGDSMEPTIPEGSLLLVDLRPGQGWKDGIYVLRVDSGLMAKRVQRDWEGALIIKSDNPAYSEMTIPKERVGEIAILGRVVWLGRRI